MIEQENTTYESKFYSVNAIRIATFLGGPLIAGYLIRANYRALAEEQKAQQALVLGIVSTLVLVVGLLLLPVEWVDRIPNYIFPAIFAGIAGWIVEVKQGDVLRLHKENNKRFYSNWKAVGLALLSALILFVTAVLLLLLWE
ncbi:MULTISPECIES: hypothetical protein [unclassified Myroides]|uniref:hypothetical protein n=1 Tax=unclassified Myroides TaxID=2642485 RepID=UPI003D2F6207